MEKVMIGSITMLLYRKEIKNLHISVLPPDGKVRISAPKHMTDISIRTAVINRIPWIKKQQRDFAAQTRQSEREIVSGESHYLWGKHYRLEVIERNGKHEIVVHHNHLTLYVNPNTTTENRSKVIQDFYRESVKAQLAVLIESWCQKMQLAPPSWHIRRMRTKWGSCNIEERRILINSELAKKPIECLEYIVVHELVHLLERRHTDRFREILDIYLPNWRERRSLLQKTPLAHENWEY